MLITSIINSLKAPPNERSEEESTILKGFTDEYMWKECTNVLKEFFNIDFLSEIRDNKQILFRLYKLYLLH